MISASSVCGRPVDSARQRAKLVDEVAQGARALAVSSSVWASAWAARPRAARFAGAGEVVHLLDRGVADAALGRVDDALEGEVVVGGDRDLEVGQASRISWRS
jgi:hypothetical protein